MSIPAPTTSTMTQSLKGKVALVTGSSRGIGAAAIIRLAAHGADVVVNYVASQKPAELVAEQCRSYGVRAITVQADVSKLSGIESLFDVAVKEFGKIDIVFSNAGIESWGAPDEVNEEEFDKVFDVNVKAQFFVTQQAYKHMNDFGRLILISSLSAQKGIQKHSIYSASKAAIQGMVRSLACDFGPRNITVNCVAPGGIKTDMYTEAAAKYLPGGEHMTPEEIDEKHSQWSPLNRPGFPDDVSGVIALLASPESQWITGQTLQINGGAHMT